MADTTNNVSTEETTVRVERIHVDEFLAKHPDFSAVYKAGFKATTNKIWMFEDEWQQALDEYTK